MSLGRISVWVRTLMVLAVLLVAAGCKKRVPEVPPSQEGRSTELTLSSIQPGEGRTDQEVAVSLLGTAFQAGARVTLGDTPLETHVTSPQTLEALVPRGFRPGTYDVTVRNNDGKEARLKAAYSALAPSSTSVLPGSGQDCNLKNVYFDFDQALLTDDARETLQANMSCMKARGVKRVRVEGHADERGSTDYNLSLGQQRAEAVRLYYADLGATGLSTLSYGEEKPEVRGRGESVWSQNRRAVTHILE